MGLANEIISATVAAGCDIRWAGATERTAKPEIGSGTNRAIDFKFEEAVDVESEQRSPRPLQATRRHMSLASSLIENR